VLIEEKASEIEEEIFLANSNKVLPTSSKLVVKLISLSMLSSVNISLATPSLPYVIPTDAVIGAGVSLSKTLFLTSLVILV